MKIFLLSVITVFAAAICGYAQAPLVLQKTIPLPGVVGGFNHHSADGQHHRVFVCATTNKSIEVVDLDTGATVKSLPGEKPAATCFIRDLNLLCVSRGNHIELYDGTSFALTSTLALPGNVDELHYDARSKQLLAGCMTAPNEGIAVIDLAGRKVLQVIKASHPQGLAVDDTTERVFVSTPRNGGITVLDLKSEAVAADWKLVDAAGNYPVDLDAMHHRLFVGCRHPTKLVVLDAEKGNEVGRADINADTDDLSFDGANRRIYVACGDGVISVVEEIAPDHYRTTATLPTGRGARNCVLVPETAQFCVTVPEQDSRPAELLVYRVSPRS